MVRYSITDGTVAGLIATLQDGIAATPNGGNNTVMLYDADDESMGPLTGITFHTGFIELHSDASDGDEYAAGCP